MPTKPDISRPLQADEVAVWRALKRLSEKAFALVEHEILSATGLSGADFGVLTRLHELGGGTLQQHELAKSLGWNKPRLSQQLTRMSARALLHREAHDRVKGVTICLLPAGRKAVLLARPVHAAAVRNHVLRHLQPQEAQLIVDLVERMA